jgi:hypothetical protein
MRSATKILVVLFIMLEAVAALGMLAMSVHGPAGLPLAAVVYCAVAASLTVWAARRLGSPWHLGGVGLALLALTPAIVAALSAMESRAYRRDVAATLIGNVRDEPILSASGSPIGVRLSYTVTAPKRGYYGVLPSLDEREPSPKSDRRLGLSAARWTNDGSSVPIRFEAYATHEMMVELYPPLLFFGQKGRCRTTSLVPASLPTAVNPAPLRVSISGTQYGNVYQGDTERLTRGS